MYFPILLWHASMLCLKYFSVMLLSFIVTILLTAPLHLKRVTLMIPLSLGLRKISHRLRSGDLRGCSSTAMILSARNSRVLRALLVGVLSWLSSHDLSCHNSCFFTKWIKHTPLDFLVDSLTDCLVLWQEIAVKDTSHIEKRDFCLSYFPRPQPRPRLPLPFFSYAWG